MLCAVGSSFKLATLSPTTLNCHNTSHFLRDSFPWGRERGIVIARPNETVVLNVRIISKVISASFL